MLFRSETTRQEAATAHPERVGVAQKCTFCKERIDDDSLCEAIRDAGRGLIDAELGHGLIKQRVARSGGGKRSGYRTIIAFRVGNRAVFLFGFAKNRMDNVEPDELALLAKTAARWISASEELLEEAVLSDELKEVFCAPWIDPKA